MGPKWQRGLSAKFHEQPTNAQIYKICQTTIYQNWVCLLWKFLVDLVGVFCPLLRPHNTHITKHQKMLEIHVYECPYIFHIFPLKGPSRERMKFSSSRRLTGKSKSCHCWAAVFHIPVLSSRSRSSSLPRTSSSSWKTQDLRTFTRDVVNQTGHRNQENARKPGSSMFLDFVRLWFLLIFL